MLVRTVYAHSGQPQQQLASASYGATARRLIAASVSIACVQRQRVMRPASTERQRVSEKENDRTSTGYLWETVDPAADGACVRPTSTHPITS